MSLYLTIFIVIILIQRITEYMIARRNEKWMIDRGGIEYGKNHNRWLVSIQIGFFISFFFELAYKQFQYPQLNIVWLLLFIKVQCFRIWSIYSLRNFWHTKRIILPNVIIFRKGIYKYVKDPHQLIISLELIIIPLMFGTYLTAIIFPISYIISLTMRTPIREKNKTFVEKM